MLGVIDIQVPGITDTLTRAIETIEEHPVRLPFNHKEGGRIDFPAGIIPVGQFRRENNIVFNG